MRNTKLFFVLVVLFITMACSTNESRYVVLNNTLDIERNFETIELSSSFLSVEDLSSVGIRDLSSGELLVTQLVDTNSDGENDLLLFQANMAPKTENKYEIVSILEEDRPVSEAYCYSRFVPERTDDYAWENNKVAFRVFGPVAQKMVEDGIPGGTLTSGVDAWLKRVAYPIINKWYKKNAEGPDSYHVDTGEGLDNFHVGVSRGVGGIAVKSDSVYYYSKNFVAWKTITTGPIRTSFYLEYENWNADGKMVHETRVVSLDYGSNLSKFNVTMSGVDSFSAGLTLHEKDGKITSDSKTWMSYWQPHGKSELGTAIVANGDTFITYERYESDKRDLSNAYVNLKLKNNTSTYYTGFCWKESGQFESPQAWEQYLREFSLKISNPVVPVLTN